jgi:hypothetical protein
MGSRIKWLQAKFEVSLRSMVSLALALDLKGMSLAVLVIFDQICSVSWWLIHA